MNKQRARGAANTPLWTYVLLFGTAFAIIIVVALGLRTELDAAIDRASTGDTTGDGDTTTGDGDTAAGAGAGAVGGDNSTIYPELPSMTPSATVTPTPAPESSTATPAPRTASPAVANIPPVPFDVPATGASQPLRVLSKVPHNPASFLQGLEYYEGTFIESTGMWGPKSKLMQIVPENGTVLKSVTLTTDTTYFGEGSTVWGDEIYWITWKNEECFVYDLDTFEWKRTYSYDTTSAIEQGWGLTHDDTHLIMSDGSARIFYRDPESFEIVHTISITSYGSPLVDLNELELVEGYLYANVWHLKKIAVFKLPTLPTDVTTIEVEAWLDMTYIKNNLEFNGVVNGVAFNDDTRTLWLSGKKWNNIYEVELPDHSMIGS